MIFRMEELGETVGRVPVYSSTNLRSKNVGMHLLET